jgi:hypothetical protein
MKRLLGCGTALAITAIALLVIVATGERHAATTAVETPHHAGVANDQAASTAAPRDEAALDLLLAQIVADARRTGVLSNDDARRGYAAVRALAPQLGRDGAHRRLLALGRTYRQLVRELALAPIQRELAELESQIAASTDPRKRAGLRRQYQAAAQKLPEPHRYDALARASHI